MDYSFELGEKSTIKVKLNLSSEEWEKAIEQAYQKNKGKYAQEGFRKGKVPRKFLENMYGKGIFFEDAINLAFPQYYGEFLDKEVSIFPVGRPDIDVDKIDDNGLTIIATVPVKPEVKLGAYKGITISKIEYNVTDADIENELKTLQNRNSRTVEVTNRPAENEDITTIDYSGSVDSVKFEGGTAENQNLVLGSNQFIPGFEEQVVGMNINETKDVKVKFPEEYHSKDLAGKDAIFVVTLKKLEKKELPEINDEFIKEATEFSSLEEFKSAKTKQLQENNTMKAEREIENKFIETITSSSEVEIPDAMIENQVEQMINDMRMRMSYQGLKLEDYLKYMGQTMEDYKKGMEETAKLQVKSQLVISKIVDTEKLKVSDADMEVKYNEMATRLKKDVEEYKKGVTAEQKNYFENELMIKSLFDFLKANNQVK